MAEPYLDLMAFTRGAEAANTANWNDALRDVQLRTSEASLTQSQQAFNNQQEVFDSQRPLREAQTQDRLDSLSAQRAVSQASADILRDVSRQAPEAQAGYLAATLYDRLGQAKNPLEVSGLTNLGRQQMLLAMKRGDVQGARAIANVLPGQNFSAGLQAYEQWNNPAYFNDPANITAAGGEVMPDGRVRYGGVPLTRPAFALLQKGRAINQSFDVPAALAPMAQREQGIQAQQTFAGQLNVANPRVQYLVGPNGELLQVPVVQPVPMPFEPAMIPIPEVVMAPGQTPIPAGVTPSQAGAGRGVVNPPLVTDIAAIQAQQAQIAQQRRQLDNLERMLNRNAPVQNTTLEQLRAAFNISPSTARQFTTPAGAGWATR